MKKHTGLAANADGTVKPVEVLLDHTAPTLTIYTRDGMPHPTGKRIGHTIIQGWGNMDGEAEVYTVDGGREFILPLPLPE